MICVYDMFEPNIKIILFMYCFYKYFIQFQIFLNSGIEFG